MERGKYTLFAKVASCLAVFGYIVSMFLISQADDCHFGQAVVQNCRDNSVLCRPVVEFSAVEEGYYNVNFSDYSGVEVYLLAGESYSVHVPPQVEQVLVWYNDAMLALINVDYGNCEASSEEPVDDGRTNEQVADSFFAVYVTSGWLDVYATGSGEGVLILHTQVPACSADLTACFDGSILTLIDPENKVYTMEVNLVD